MSYRCCVCESTAPKNSPRIVHIVYRPKSRMMYRMDGDGILVGVRESGMEIDREYPVCPLCNDGLKLGVSISDLAKQKGIYRRVLPAKVIPPTVEPMKIGKPMTTKKTKAK